MSLRKNSQQNKPINDKREKFDAHNGCFRYQMPVIHSDTESLHISINHRTLASPFDYIAFAAIISVYYHQISVSQVIEYTIVVDKS